MNDKIAEFLEKRYSIVNDEGGINLSRFFNDFYNGVAYSRAFNEAPIYSEKRKTVSEYNPSYDLYVDGAVKATNSNNNKEKQVMSIKKLIAHGMVFCFCGSDSFTDEHQYIRCNKCQNVELKKHIIVGKAKEIKIKGKNYQYAKRCRILAEEWGKFLPSQQLRNRLERYALKDYELPYIKLMRRTLASRKMLIQQMNLGVETNPFSDKRHQERFNYDRAEHGLRAKAYNAEFLAEMAQEGQIDE